MGNYNVLDLFCGAGGLSSGFEKEGFDVVGVDIERNAGRTYVRNLDANFVLLDLSGGPVLRDGNFEVIVGGPPCKPFSIVNLRSRGYLHPDYPLLSRFFDNVSFHNPSIFLLENVPGLLRSRTFALNIKKIENEYSVDNLIIRYSDFGAATSRHRLITFGIRKPRKAKLFFEKLDNCKQNALNVENAIGRLRDKSENSEPDHVWPKLTTIDRYKDKYKSHKYGWYVLNWDEPAPSFGNIMKTYILHPESFNGGVTRVISVKEASLIMGFDNDFTFPEKIGIGAKYQMIVDAVSPVFSKIAAGIIGQILR